MWIAVAVLLVIARFLPVALPRRTVGVVICVSLAAAGFGLCSVVSSIRSNTEIERSGSLDPLIAELARNYQPGRPTLLIIGSSRSTLGLDGVALERKLNGLGRDVQVVQFTATGHYALEQLHTTRQLLDRLRPERLTVLVELGTEIDLGVSNELAYTSRGIEFYDGGVFATNFKLWRSARGGNADHPEYTVRQLLRALAHTGLHHLGVGLLFDLVPPSPPGRQKGFAPRPTPPTEAVMQTTREALAAPATSIPVPSDRRELVTIVRNELAAELATLVPGRVDLIFFLPPTAGPEMRAEAPGACGAVAHLGPCLHMTDEEVRARLPADNWLDTNHMTAPGAVNFTDWLAPRLAEKL